VVVSLFKVLSRYLLGGTEENYSNLNEDIQSRGQDFNSGSSKCEVQVLTIQS
jgi:hypothetical protein